MENLSKVSVFKDLNFEKLIRDTLNKPDGEITCEDMARIERLKGEKLGITDISGIEYCYNLTGLCLDNTKVTNLEPLRNLGNLEEFEFYEMPNAVDSLTPIFGLLNLKTLCIGIRRYSDLQEIGNLINLETLELLIYEGDEIDDIVPVSNLVNLKKFTLDARDGGVCNVSDLNLLKHLNGLEEVNVDSHKWIDQSPVKHIENLYIGMIGKSNFYPQLDKLESAILEKCDAVSLDIHAKMCAVSHFGSHDDYRRIFGLCERLRITHLYDLGCAEMRAGFFMGHYPSLTYTGIEQDEELSAYNKTHIVDFLIENFGERIKFQAGWYPDEDLVITPPENNLAIGLYGAACAESEEGIKNIAAALSKDFERIIINFGHEWLETWKRELAASFEVYKIGESYGTTFIFCTKFPEDIAGLKKHYKFIDNEFMTGIGYDG